MLDYQIGQMYYADLGTSGHHEQRGMRPVVVICEDETYHALVTICPMTKTITESPTHVKVHADALSDIMCEQIRSIDKFRFKSCIGTLPASKIEELLTALKNHFKFKEKDDVKTDNQLQIFNYSDRQVRTVEKDGEVWFVAKDVCDILEIVDTWNAISRLSDQTKGTHSISTLGGNQEMNIINEAGVYKLVFSSRKPEAEKFTDWLAAEVIPSIRKHGAYMTPEVIEQTLLNPDYIIKLAIAIKTEREGRLVAEHKAAELQPKADFYDTVTGSKDCIDIGTVAKVINFSKGRTTLFRILRDNSILMANNIPYQEFCDRHYFRVIESTYTSPKTGEVHENYKTVVYQKGIDFIRRFLIKKGYMKDVICMSTASMLPVRMV
jgi:prophage antirepressor-like protein/mRNA-degrading endonuclease toxin of MazEF toxin-antitoxin module